MYELEIIGFNHQGLGIGKIDGKVVFVEDALVNEKVLVEIIKDSKNYMIGRVITRLRDSEDRCRCLCKYYNRCGGCNVATLIYEKQLKFKKDKVINIFKKYIGIEVMPKIIGTNQWYYRNKVALHVIDGKMGYYEKNSNNIIELDKCLIASNSINKVIESINNKIDLKEVSKITIRNTYRDIMVAIEGNINTEKLIKTIGFATSIYVNDELVYGKDKIIEKIGEYLFYISKDAFFQVNTPQAYNLYNHVLTLANLNKDDVVLDLYCGTGTIGIFLSKYCKKVIGIEINKTAIEDANLNRKLNNVSNISFINDSSSIISKMKIDANVVVVDPPRSGLDKVTIETLMKNKIDKIIYVSCNPMTLARDIKKLSDVYEFKEITLFDMFAQDYHIESVVLLERVDVEKYE